MGCQLWVSHRQAMGCQLWASHRQAMGHQLWISSENLLSFTALQYPTSVNFPWIFCLPFLTCGVDVQANVWVSRRHLEAQTYGKVINRYRGTYQKSNPKSRDEFGSEDSCHGNIDFLWWICHLVLYFTVLIHGDVGCDVVWHKHRSGNSLKTLRPLILCICAARIFIIDIVRWENHYNTAVS